MTLEIQGPKCSGACSSTLNLLMSFAGACVTVCHPGMPDLWQITWHAAMLNIQLF